MANYFNETMIDNAHPMSTGTKCYLQNFINDNEQEYLLRAYLTVYYQRFFRQTNEKVSLEAFLSKEVPKLKAEVKNCLLLNNYFWAMWGIKMLKKVQFKNAGVFNYEFVI